MIANSELIKWLLEESEVTKYQISKVTGIHQTTLANIQEGTALIENLSFKNAAALTNFAEMVKEKRSWRTLEIQYDNNPASWWDIWSTKVTTLEEAWGEMDERPTETGWIRFHNGDGVTMRVNNEEK